MNKDCKHELHVHAVDVLKKGEAQFGQCLKCGKAISLSEIEEKKEHKKHE